MRVHELAKEFGMSSSKLIEEIKGYGIVVKSHLSGLDDDRVAGLNNLWKNELDKGIDTGLTGVHRDYRRKGVATALKHTSLIWAKKQGYEWIRTDNASTNKGMLNINIRVGFKFMPAWLIFDKILKK